MKRKIGSYGLLALFAGLLVYASGSLPDRGDPEAPMHRETSRTGGPVAGSYYVREAYKDAATPNMVTVVLADYRSFDTLGETIVVFTAAMACLLMLRKDV